MLQLKCTRTSLEELKDAICKDINNIPACQEVFSDMHSGQEKTKACTQIKTEHDK